MVVSAYPNPPIAFYAIDTFCDQGNRGLRDWCKQR